MAVWLVFRNDPLSHAFEPFEESIVVLALAIGIILLFRRFKLPGVLPSSLR